MHIIQIAMNKCIICKSGKKIVTVCAAWTWIKRYPNKINLNVGENAQQNYARHHRGDTKVLLPIEFLSSSFETCDCIVMLLLILQDDAGAYDSIYGHNTCFVLSFWFCPLEEKNSVDHDSTVSCSWLLTRWASCYPEPSLYSSPNQNFESNIRSFDPAIVLLRSLDLQESNYL